MPENTLKFTVGLLLSTFGTFWTAEGARAVWPGGDISVLGILAVYALASWNMLRAFTGKRGSI